MHIPYLFLGLLIPCYASGQVLYNVTFSPPAHQLNQPASVGGGPATPSANIFGTSRISADIAGHDRSMLFVPNTPGSLLNYSQYQFGLGTTGSDKYLRTQYDVFVASMSPPASGTYHPGPDDGFSVIFDTPPVVRLDFIGSGQILDSQGTALGSFLKGSWISMVIDVDLTQNMWTVYENGSVLTHSQFFYPVPASPSPPSAVYGVRMNLADNESNPATPQVYVDNILIETSNTPFSPVPEPSPYELLGVGALIFFARFAWFRRGLTTE